MKTLLYFLLSLIFVEWIRSALTQQDYNPLFIAGFIAGALTLRIAQFYDHSPRIRARRSAARRRKRLARNGGSHTRAEWELLKIKHGYRCISCNKIKPLTKDHIIPVSRGGTNYIRNIQPMCQSCNSRKGNRV